jgi:C4-dicarboxylate-specific signal transduction histidine kinase
MRGKQPYWPDNLMKRHVQPVAKAIGIHKKIGGHTFRHSSGTLLKANGEDAMSQVSVEQRVLTLKTAIQSQSRSGLLVVEDQGPGVPDKLRDKLFQSFFSTKGDELGMGLTICLTIRQTLGGSIQLRNNAEPGAKFQVVLRSAS